MEYFFFLSWACEFWLNFNQVPDSHDWITVVVLALGYVMAVEK